MHTSNHRNAGKRIYWSSGAFWHAPQHWGCKKPLSCSTKPNSSPVQQCDSKGFLGVLQLWGCKKPKPQCSMKPNFSPAMKKCFVGSSDSGAALEAHELLQSTKPSSTSTRVSRPREAAATLAWSQSLTPSPYHPALQLSFADSLLLLPMKHAWSIPL